MSSIQIIPAIYTYDSKSSQTSSINILEYDQAFNLALSYQNEGADCIYILDVSVNHERKRGLLKFLKHLSQHINLPIIVGGGVHNVKDVEDILAAGASKVTVNSAAVKNPELINAVIKSCGTESLIIGIDTKRSFGEWKVYLNGAKSRTEIDFFKWVKMCKLKGAGELVITLVPRKHDNFDEYPVEILQEATNQLEVPVYVTIGNIRLDALEGITKLDGIKGIISGTYFLNQPGKLREVKALI